MTTNNRALDIMLRSAVHAASVEGEPLPIGDIGSHLISEAVLRALMTEGLHPTHHDLFAHKLDIYGATFTLREAVAELERRNAEHR